MQSATISTQPAMEPVSVTEAKQFMRIDIEDDDDLIADLILAARAMAEEYTRRKFITTGITLTLDSLPKRKTNDWWDGVREGHQSMLVSDADSIKLPFPPAISVTSITSYNDANSASVFSSSAYRLDTAGGVVCLNDGYSWPDDLRNKNALSIVYTCGYGSTPASVPSPIRHAIKMIVASLYENRTCFDMPVAAKAALSPYVIMHEVYNGV